MLYILPTGVQFLLTCTPHPSVLSIERLQEKSSAADKIREQNNEVQLKIKELEHNVSKHHKESHEAAEKVRKLSFNAPV